MEMDNPPVEDSEVTHAKKVVNDAESVVSGKQEVETPAKVEADCTGCVHVPLLLVANQKSTMMLHMQKRLSTMLEVSCPENKRLRRLQNSKLMVQVLALVRNL